MDGHDITAAVRAAHIFPTLHEAIAVVRADCRPTLNGISSLRGICLTSCDRGLA
jgi:hypothetical protein